MRKRNLFSSIEDKNIGTMVIDLKVHWLSDELDIYLAYLQKNATNSQKSGMYALKLKIAGYSNVEISRVFHVKPELIRKWISRTKKLLQDNKDINKIIN